MTSPSRPPSPLPRARGLAAAAACAAVLLASLGNEGLVPGLTPGRGGPPAAAAPAGDAPDGAPALGLLRSREFGVGGTTFRPFPESAGTAAATVAVPIDLPAAAEVAAAIVSGPACDSSVPLHVRLCVWRV